MKRPEAKRVRRSAADRPFRFSQSSAATGPRVPTYHGVQKKKIFFEKTILAVDTGGGYSEFILRA